jgi:hypothetical protein
VLFAERRAIPGWRQALSEEVKVNIERFQIMTIWLAVAFTYVLEERPEGLAYDGPSEILETR